MNFLRAAAAPLLAAAAFLCAWPAQAASYLWEVSSLTNRVYLFGTVHAGKPSWYPLPHAVDDAFQGSRVLVVEADITDEQAMAKSQASAMYVPPANLKTHVPAEDYVRFRKLLQRYEIPEDQVIRMKPFMAASMLVFNEWARQGYTPTYGVDLYLLTQAKEQHKTIVELEGVDEQIRLMDSFSNDETLRLFHGTLEALESGLTGEQVHGLVKAWQAGDPEGVLAVARRYNDRIAGAAEFEDRFIWSRHETMLKKIRGYLDDTKERHFIAVGALHLAGPRGLVERLRKMGYIVKQL